MLQKEALEILKTGVNVFLTGVPGSGKTFVINQYINYLENHGIYPSVTASTGIAATHIGGQTIHSFSGLGIEKDLDDYKIEKILEREKLVKKIQSTKVLIIDEISMLDAQTLDNVDKVLKAIKNPEKPFGGVQIIFVGDFFQLPPVVKFGETMKFFAFHSRSWKEAKPLTCYLEEQFRQTDEVFNKLLLAIRSNSIDEMHIEILENLKNKKSSNLDILELHSHNKNVDEINYKKLNLIPETEFVYKMLTQGRRVLVEGLIKNCLSPEILKLKVGAKVIFTKNSLEGEYVNGTLGEIIELQSFFIKVRTKNGMHVDVKQTDWSIEEEGKVKAKISQYPLRLAWAITVHKSQGMSLDEASVHLGDTFEYGQGYVALSRLRSLEGLFLKSYNQKSLQVNEDISIYDEKIQKDSQFIQEKLKKADLESLKKTQTEFIKKSGGNLSGRVPKKPKILEVKKDTAQITLELLQQAKNIEEIINIRNLKFESIVKHLDELFHKTKITKEEIANSLAKSEKFKKINIFSIPNEVKKSFKENKFKKDDEGNIKLAPIFKDLKEKYSYEELKVYRIFLKS